jgi:hypothetical protein
MRNQNPCCSLLNPRKRPLAPRSEGFSANPDSFYWSETLAPNIVAAARVISYYRAGRQACRAAPSDAAPRTTEHMRPYIPSDSWRQLLNSRHYATNLIITPVFSSDKIKVRSFSLAGSPAKVSVFSVDALVNSNSDSLSLGIPRAVPLRG